MNADGDLWVKELSDRYQPQRELGRGGMAVVYLARDLKHDRDVALKVLRPELSEAVGRDRFEQEIRLTARLQHPHILTVFDSGESAGQLWYTMPFVDGETLRECLNHERRLPVDRAMRMAYEIASALAYAHEAGVVHRDIKPENILIARQGQALVADFGIAKALTADTGFTETGASLGTPAYMAPEQLMGERPVRAQVDVYALGTMLYEMLSGERPFADLAPAAMLARRLTDGAPPLSTVRGDVPAALAQLVSDALAADPSRRPANGAAVVARLRDAASVPAVLTSTPSTPAQARRRLMIPLAAVVVIAGVAAVAALVATDNTGSSEASIGVLPFENRSGDTLQRYLSDGVSDELTSRLSAIHELHVAPRSSAVRFRGSLEAPEAIARQLAVTYVLTGSFVRHGDSIRVTAELVDAPARRERWSRVYVGPARVLAAIVDSVSREVVLALVPGASARGGAGVLTRDSLAYDHYLLAQHHWNRFTERDLVLAVAYADSAIGRDPVFVNAWLTRLNALLALATDNGRLTGRQVIAQLRQATDTVLALDPRSIPARAARGMALAYFEWDWDAADRDFRQAFANGSPEALIYIRASFLQSVRGHVDSALALNATARRIEPTNLRAFGGGAAYYGRRYAETLALATRALSLDPYFPPGLQFQALGLSGLGRHAEAIAVARLAATTPTPSRTLHLIAVLAAADSVTEARALIHDLEQRAVRDGIGAGILYRGYAAVGDLDRAFLWLDRAIAERSYNVAFLNVDPMIDPLRSDPRLEAARQRAGVPAPN